MVKKTKIVQNTEILNQKDSNQKDSNQKDFTIAETFVGCGGSHFGFKKAGFKSIFVNDMWDDAIETLRINNSDLNDNQIILDNIENIDAEYLSQRNINYENLDVLFGGIVCKGFSLAGIRNPYDPRNYLYLQQLRLVEILRPKISIIENVPGIMSMKILKRDESIKEMCIKLTDICENHKKLRGKLIALTKDDSPISIIEGVKDELNSLTFERKQLEDSLEGYMYNVIEHIKYININFVVLPVALTLKASPFQAQASQAASPATNGEAQSGIEALEKERAQWEAKYTALASASSDEGGSEEVGMLRKPLQVGLTML